MRELDDLFAALSRSTFRQSFRLRGQEHEYLQVQGMEALMTHAADIIEKRLAPAVIPNDGKQTPFRGHPVFVAQHATACCCRGCLQKWHRIPAGHALTDDEKTQVLQALERWLTQHMQDAPPARARPSGPQLKLDF